MTNMVLLCGQYFAVYAKSSEFLHNFEITWIKHSIDLMVLYQILLSIGIILMVVKRESLAPSPVLELDGFPPATSALNSKPVFLFILSFSNASHVLLHL